MNSVKRIVCGILAVLSVPLFCLFVYFGFIKKEESRWYYKIDAHETQMSVELLGEVRERDKPVMYKISVGNLAPMIVDEATYNEWYRDYNAITVVTHSISLYKMVQYGHIGEKIKAEDYVWDTRYEFPYSTDFKPYTMEDVLYAMTEEGASSMRAMVRLFQITANSYEDFESTYKEYIRYE